MLDVQLIFPAMIGISKGMYPCKIFINIYQNHSAISKTKRIVIYPHLPPPTNRMSWPWVNYEIKKIMSLKRLDTFSEIIRNSDESIE